MYVPFARESDLPVNGNEGRYLLMKFVDRGMIIERANAVKTPRAITTLVECR